MRYLQVFIVPLLLTKSNRNKTLASMSDYFAHLILKDLYDQRLGILLKLLFTLQG